MTERDGVWIVVADGKCARLLRCSLVPPGRYHVEEVARIEHEKDRREHARPSPRMGRAGGTGQRHEQEEELRRFARQIASWISRQQQKQETKTELTLTAPPQLLGTLRRVGKLNGQSGVTLHEADLAELSEAEIARHRLVQDLIRDHEHARV